MGVCMFCLTSPRPDSLDFYDSSAANPVLRPVLNITFSTDAAVIGAGAEADTVEDIVGEGVADYYTDDNAGMYAHFLVAAAGDGTTSTASNGTTTNKAPDSSGASGQAAEQEDDTGTGMAPCAPPPPRLPAPTSRLPIYVLLEFHVVNA
jgi:hypothetical protein